MKKISLLLLLTLLAACNGSKDSSGDEAEDLAEELETCNLYGAPTSLKYSQSSVEVLKGVAIPRLSATYNSALPVSFRVTPELPAGVSISLISGEVMGTPSIPGDRVYTLIAANQCGAATFDLRLKVNEFAPSALMYPAATYSISLGDNFPTITPTVTNNPSTFAISPALPEGMLMDPTTGRIYGKPFTSQTQTTYTVTASNTGGSTGASIKITILGKAPNNLSYQNPSRTYKAGVEQAANFPLYSGDTATSFSISPALPEGLSINANSGAINGNPEEVINSKIYVVTATNTWGSSTAQVSLSVLPHVNALSTGEQHTCLIKNRKVRCQGRNDKFQLGYVSASSCQDINNDFYPCSRSMNFVEVSNSPLRATQLALGKNTSCALSLDQKVYCWGDNREGQGGNYTNEASLTSPQLVRVSSGVELSGVVSLKAGLEHFCALTSESELYCWGDNTRFQLGLAGVTKTNHALLSATNVSKFALGTEHSCVVQAGLPSCVGFNSFSQLSNTSVSSTSSFISALKVSSAFEGVTDLWLGESFSIFKEANKFFGAGRNLSGELGFSDLTAKPLATEVLSNLAPTQIAPGLASLCYTVSGFGYCQGLNDNNFANPLNLGAANPTPLEIMEDVSLPFVNIELISQGFSRHRCVSRNGEAYCFGLNHMGQVSEDTDVVKIYPSMLETP